MVRWVVGSILHGGPTELFLAPEGARCRSVVRAFAHGAMGRRIDPSWGGPIELFLAPEGARCSSVVRAFAHGAMDRRIDPSWWAHRAIYSTIQYSMTGVTKAVVCAVLSVGWCM